MPPEIIDSVLDLLSLVFAYEAGSNEFYAVLGACFVAWILAARLMMGVARSGKGFIAAFLALSIPLCLGLFAYGLAEWQVVPKVEAAWADQYLALGMLGVVSFLTILVTAKRFFALSGPASIFIFILASGASVGAYYGVEIALDVFNEGSEQLKRVEEQTSEALGSEP